MQVGGRVVQVVTGLTLLAALWLGVLALLDGSANTLDMAALWLHGLAQSLRRSQGARTRKIEAQWVQTLERDWGAPKRQDEPFPGVPKLNYTGD